MGVEVLYAKDLKVAFWCFYGLATKEEFFSKVQHIDPSNFQEGYCIMVLLEPGANFDISVANSTMELAGLLEKRRQMSNVVSYQCVTICTSEQMTDYPGILHQILNHAEQGALNNTFFETVDGACSETGRDTDQVKNFLMDQTQNMPHMQWVEGVVSR